jgi:hypothetical protein
VLIRMPNDCTEPTLAVRLNEQSPFDVGDPIQHLLSSVMTKTKTQKLKRLQRQPKAVRFPARSRSRSRSRSRRRGSVRRNGWGNQDEFLSPGTYTDNPEAGGLFRPNRAENGPIVPYTPFGARAGAGRGQRSNRRSSANPLPPIVDSYIDPFSEEAACVKYPDEYRGLSGTFSTNYADSINTPLATYTDANLANTTGVRTDCALLMISPDPSNQVVVGLCGTPGAGAFFAGTANVFTWPNGIVFTNVAQSGNSFGPGSGQTNIDNVVANIGAIRNQYSGCRLVSGGVKITGTQNFATVSGTIHMAPVFVNLSRTVSNQEFPGGTQQNNPVLYEMVNGWQPALPNGLSDLTELPGYQSFPMSSLQSGDLLGLFKRAGPAALNFKPTGSAWGMNDGSGIDGFGAGSQFRYGTDDNPDGFGHYCIVVFIEGALSSTGGVLAAGTPLCRLQVRNHYEAQFNARSLTFGVLPGNTWTAGLGGAVDAHVSAPYQPLLMAAADNMCTAIPAVREVAADGDAESVFVDNVMEFWGTAKSIASSLSGAYGIASTLAALVI